VAGEFSATMTITDDIWAGVEATVNGAVAPADVVATVTATPGRIGPSDGTTIAWTSPSTVTLVTAWINGDLIRQWSWPADQTTMPGLQYSTLDFGNPFVSRTVEFRTYNASQLCPPFNLCNTSQAPAAPTITLSSYGLKLTREELAREEFYRT